MSCLSPITFEELMEGLLEMFSEDKDKINIDDVIEWFNRYESRDEDWSKFAKWDKFKYTRNLMHEGNGNFNLILMCWPEGTVSPIHDHANAHCFMRLLKGTGRETRYFWPEEKSGPDGSLIVSGTRDVSAGATLYMSDQLGLHKVENLQHTERMVSVHLYSPPFQGCNIFDERTSKKTAVNMVFYSKYGEKEDHKKKSAKQHRQPSCTAPPAHASQNQNGAVLANN